jgi:hypothetical protein
LAREVTQKENPDLLAAARPRADEITDRPGREILYLVEHDIVEPLAALLDGECAELIVEPPVTR